MILGHIAAGLVVKKRFPEVPLALVLGFSLLPEVLLPGVIFALLFPALVEKLGFVEFAMRCASSVLVVGILSLIIIGVSFSLKKLKYGLVLSLCMFLCVLLNFHVEAYWLFPLSNINLGLGIYPWQVWFWIIDIPVFLLSFAYYRHSGRKEAL